ncbi:MAG TPA: HAMP domain-containing sensor histidine kinase [Acidimicrobiia bacterium]|nr:HAMP domain-containing sensor histidine kinase [Acidimicrobiia bacterium]
MNETVELALLAAGTAAVAGVAGAVVLRALRRRSLGVQVAAVAVVAVVGVAVGAWAGARAMFLSDHDLWALGVILVAAGAVAVVSALLLGRRVGAASEALVGVARRLGDGDSRPARPGPTAPQELARLHRELEVTSQRLDQARAREQALDSSRRELVAWVSHDLRTPLAGIRAIVEALEDGLVDDPEAVARYYTTLRHEADRLAELVDDLFELSRAQAGVIQLQLERVSLGDLVSDALAGASPIAAAKGVRLEGRLDGPPAELEVSTAEVMRALRNILENAIRHTPSDGSVTVVAGRDDGGAYVSVSDTGGGIPESDLARVFDVAFCGDAARTPGDAGAGLGLAIARGFVEAHRGDITVRNENGGCRFTVHLPLPPRSR